MRPSMPALDLIDQAQPIDWGHPLARGLVGAWMPALSPGQSVLRDLTNQKRDGTLTNMNAGNYVASERGQVLQFNGSNQYVATTSPGVTGTGASTVSAWFRTNSTETSDNAIVNWGSGVAAQQYHISVENGTLWSRNGSNTANTTVGSFNDGKWHHLTLTKPAGATVAGLVFYVDGVAVGKSTSGSATLDIGTTHPVQIARNVTASGGSYYFSGFLDDLRIYDRALSAEEVWQLWSPRDRWALLRLREHRRYFVRPVEPEPEPEPEQSPPASARRHIDFEVPAFGEFNPQAIQTGDHATLTQSASASFPDRGSVGLLVSLTPGGAGGAHARIDTGSEKSPVFCRLMLNVSSAAQPIHDGAVTIAVGHNDGDPPAETFRLIYDAVSGQVALQLATSETITATLLVGLSWHCVETRIDPDLGEAELFVNGVSAGIVTGAFTDLATRYLSIGAPLKDAATAGDFYLDEVVIADGYIGPVVVAPASSYADDPARWAVLYNSADPDSVAWVDAYRQARSVPYANLIGLPLSTEEVIDAAAFAELNARVNAYLDDNGLTDHVLGLLLGLGVPGYVQFSGGGAREAVADLLHQRGSAPGPVNNPLATGDQPARPTKALLGELRLTARIDAPDLAGALGMLNKATARMAEGLGDGLSSAIWLDPYTTPGPVNDPRIAAMVQWAGGIDRMLTRLPLVLSAEEDPGQEVQFERISRDGFFWGWSAAAPPEDFFSTPAGTRVFCVQLYNAGATAPTLRSTTPADWMDTALAAGYCAAAGSARAYSASAIPDVGRFFLALRRGWTLAEAWASAYPIFRAGLFLVGDPLLKIGAPGSGWDLFGPLESSEQFDPALPIVALRQDEHALTLSAELRPAEGQTALYLLRRRDAHGRSEAGVTALRVASADGVAATPPRPPCWPDHEHWPVAAGDGTLRLSVVWESTVAAHGVAQADLLARDGDLPSQVIETITPKPHETRITTVVPYPALPTCYAWRVRSGGGVEFTTPWSRTVFPPAQTLGQLQVLEQQP